MFDAALHKALSGERTPKFLATVSAAGAPNVVPVISIEPDGDDTLLFAELMIWKTKQNLLADPRVSVAVISDDFKHWTLRGRFEGFERTGPRFDKVAGHDMFRYNAYTGPRAAGVIRVEDVMAHGGIVTPGAFAGFLGMQLGRLGGRGGRKVRMPSQVSEKFLRLKAGKCLAYPDADGYPTAVMRFGVVPSGPSRLLIGNGPLQPPVRGGQPLPAALCVISSEPVAYQVKGRITRPAAVPGALLMEVEEVFSASPPIPGKQIA